jgi:hypothetical protein
MTDSEVERARQEFAHLSYVLSVRKRLLVLTLLVGAEGKARTRANVRWHYCRSAGAPTPHWR